MKAKWIRALDWLGWSFVVIAVLLFSSGTVLAETKKMKSSVAKLGAKVVKYDAIVVGAGYSGLISGAILAKNGLKVLVVEKADQIGGRLGAVYYNGYWLEWGPRDASDFEDNFVIITEKGQYGLKAAKEAGADVAWVGPIDPLVLMHNVSDGKVVRMDADAEGGKKFFTEVLKLTPEQTTKVTGILNRLAAEDPEKWIDVPMKEWLATVKDRDEAFDKAIYWLAIVHLALPLEETSTGRWIQMFRNPQRLYRINDSKVGGLQGLAEAYARVIRKHGGEIKTGLETVEITTQDKKITGVVARDKINIVQEFQAPVVVYSEPFWDILSVINESLFPADMVKNARKLETGYVGDFWCKNIGISRLPTIRATGKTDQYIGYNQVLFDKTIGWSIPSLSSKKAAPKGKHLLCLNGTTKVHGNFASSKADAVALMDYMRRYYSDLDEIIEWENYQWPKVWGTGNTWLPMRRSPIEAPGVEGLYFVGNTVEVDGTFADIGANSAMQASKLILQKQIEK
ncbi:MAG: FAD-dependent oxidoreductase [Pseudomonadota bacterium]